MKTFLDESVFYRSVFHCVTFSVLSSSKSETFVSFRPKRTRPIPTTCFTSLETAIANEKTETIFFWSESADMTRRSARQSRLRRFGAKLTKVAKQALRAVTIARRGVLLVVSLAVRNLIICKFRC